MTGPLNNGINPEEKIYANAPECSIGGYVDTRQCEEESIFSTVSDDITAFDDYSAVDEYSLIEWEDVEPAKNKMLFFESDGYIFTANDGTKITVDDIENVQVKQNKFTGEIVIIGAKGASVKGSNEDVKLRIYDSEIAEIEMGKGNDNVFINNSVIESIETGAGNDNITINDSLVNSNVKSGDDDDYITAINSTVFELNSDNGNDNILVDNSEIINIDSGFGDDDISVKASKKIGTIDAGRGFDNIFLADSSAQIKEDKNDNIIKEDKTVSFISPEQMDASSMEKAKEITDSKTSQYTDRDLTPDEQMQAITIDFFNQNLNNMQAQFEEQEKQDGSIRDAYNWVKQLTDLGVSKEDIQKAINEQKTMILELELALDGVSDKTFEDVFKEWTGLDYNAENMAKYYETAQLYSLATVGLTKTESFKNGISSASTLDEVLVYYIRYFGDENLAREELNKTLQESFAENPVEFGYATSVEINDKNQLVITKPKEYGALGPDMDTEYVTTVKDISSVSNMMKTMSQCFDLDKYTESFADNFENTMGIGVEELQNQLKFVQMNTFGSGNSFQKLIDKYCMEQEGFSDRLASTAQMTGIGLMIVGGVVTFVAPPAGVTLMSAGKVAAVGGVFADNAIDLVDGLSSEYGISKDEAWTLAKETLTDIALLYSGAKINGVSTNVKDIVLSQTQNKILSSLAEIGTDASLSLLSDLVITGELDITSEGISQIISILTGIAGAKVDAYTKDAFDNADVLFKNGDVEEALNFLDSKGIPQRQVYQHFKDTEFEKIKSIYAETGKIEDAILSIKNSKILTEADLKQVTAELKLNELEKYGVNVNDYRGYEPDSMQGKLVFEDINMYYKAVTEGINVNDLMVLTAKTVESGVQSVKIGDVFATEGSDKIFIKTSDDSYKQLDISKEAYCRLFPAIQRYSSGQGNSGDCYLVSTLNSIMATPSEREKLLSCFSENEDGSINVKMPTSDTEILIGANQTINDLGLQKNKHVKGALGIQLLEYIYKISLVDDKTRIFSEDLEHYNQIVLSKYNEYVEKNGHISLDEYKQLVTSMPETIKQDLTNILSEDLSDAKLNELVDIVLFTKGDTSGILYYLQDIPEISPDTSAYTKLTDYISANRQKMDISSCLSYMKSIEKTSLKISEIINDENKIEELGGHGGRSTDVFNALGYDKNAIKWSALGDSELLNALFDNPDLQNDYIVVASTYSTETNQLKQKGLVDNHAYSFQVRENGKTGEIEIVVTNPWNLLGKDNKDIVLSQQEFLECFYSISYVKTN